MCVEGVGGCVFGGVGFAVLYPVMVVVLSLCIICQSVILSGNFGDGINSV